MNQLRLAFVLGLFAISAVADTISIPENLRDGADVLITNYTWVNENAIFVCEPGTLVCNQNTRTFSDLIDLSNSGGKAETLFISDIESLLSLNPNANNIFRVEAPGFSVDFDATDAGGIKRTLTLNLSSDLDPTPLGGESDSITVIAPTGAPNPQLQVVPEPTYTVVLFVGVGILSLFRLSWPSLRPTRKGNWRPLGRRLNTGRR
jgi:hypothetical protein